MNARRTQHGFTLLELLLVILITGILAAVVAPVMREPVTAYFDQAARAELVYSAEMALRKIARDARRSLPYSVRLNAAQTAVEFVGVADVARYRPNVGGPNDQRLRVDQADDSFNLRGRFNIHGTGTLGVEERLVVFNLGSSGRDIYQGDPSATPAATTVTISTDGNEHRVELAPGHQFELDSPSTRVFIASGAISYACFNGGLYRAAGYGYLATQPPPATVAGGVLLTDNVTACRFDYDPGNSGRPGLLVMTLTLARDGERITLLREVHIPNAT